MTNKPMNRMTIKQGVAMLLVASGLAGSTGPALAAAKDAYLSPTALAATSDGKTLFVACATANQVAVYDIGSRKVKKTISVPDSPLGLVLSANNADLYVTCAAPESTICIVDVARGKITKSIPGGHTTLAPVLSPDEKRLYVCDRFNNRVSIIDLAHGKVVAQVAVPREPIAATLTSDGKFLLVANHLHAGRADADYVAATVSVIDTAAAKVVKELALPNGSGLLREIRVSPDGKHACLAHQLSRFHLPTTQVERGWVNSNALTLIDLATMKVINTVLLDNIDSGAANPWAVAWTADSKQICVTHAGTHELSVIDTQALLAKLAKLPEVLDPTQKPDYSVASRTVADVPNDLSFLVGLRKRIKLAGVGPRAVVVAGSQAYVADYFSDALDVVDIATSYPAPSLAALGPRKTMSVVRRGEMLFNDATICFQGWQSCASCHSHDARVDGLNWDLLNDGIGNPKNGKSLLLAHQTPPAMALGIRPNAEAAVRAGIRHEMFTVQPEADACAMDEYLKSLKPIPSPYLVKGKLSPAAQRGKKIFEDEQVSCSDCHKSKLFTDKKLHDVGTRSRYDKPKDEFDTSTVIEVWRSGPYLHDGSAATIRDVITANKKDQHGVTSHLKPEQIDDLIAYVLSL